LLSLVNLANIFFMKNWQITVIVVAAAAVAAYFLFPSDTAQAPENGGEQTNLYSSQEYANSMVTLKTSEGDIKIEFYSNDAPKASENFARLAESGYYNGVIFHRVIANFMIQGGDPTGTGRGGESSFEGGGSFADELNPATESFRQGYVRGTVAMANSGPDTNRSQFFIVHRDSNLQNNYTIFGRVVEGMDVVDKIATAPVNGDRPVNPVVIEEARVNFK
jgi:cyclophilin family peptidyl-prolyl cis-trans isomerase